MQMEKKNCPNCIKEMVCVYKPNTRVIMGRLVTIPGPPDHYYCKDCGYEEIINLSQE